MWKTCNLPVEIYFWGLQIRRNIFNKIKIVAIALPQQSVLEYFIFLVYVNDLGGPLNLSRRKYLEQVREIQ